MKEELVSFETAKLAKEKLFFWGCDFLYDTDGEKHYTQYYDSAANNDTIEGEWFSSLSENQQAFCSCPTQSLLQKWLREEHGIYSTVTVDIESQKYSWELWQFEKNEGKSGVWEAFNTYEQALDEALFEALKLLP